MPDDSAIHLFHSLWSGALTILGGLIVWNWNRLTKEIDEKADKSEVTQLRSDLAERWRQQDTIQAENRKRLDRILEGIYGIRNNRDK